MIGTNISYQKPQLNNPNNKDIDDDQEIIVNGGSYSVKGRIVTYKPGEFEQVSAE